MTPRRVACIVGALGILLVLSYFVLGRGNETAQPRPDASSRVDEPAPHQERGNPDAVSPAPPVLDTAPQTAEPPPGVLSGKVLFADGTPAGGAAITVRHVADGAAAPLEAGAAEADAEGDFHIGGLQLGWQILQAAHGTQSAQVGQRLLAHAPAANVLVVLRVAEGIGGTVVDARGRPVEQARVYPLLHEKRTRTTSHVVGAAVPTDADGQFLLNYLEDGNWTLYVESEGFAPTVSPEIHTGTYNARIELLDGLVLTGAVVHDADESAVPAATITLSPQGSLGLPQTVRSGGDGSFRFAAVAPGAYFLQATYRAQVLKDSPLPIMLDTASKHLLLRLEDGGTIRGRVLERESGEGIAAIEIEARTAEEPRERVRSASSGEQGEFVLSGLAAGTYSISVSQYALFHAFLRERVTINMRPGQVVEDVTLLISKGSQISGRVLDHENLPVAGAEVRGTGGGWQDYRLSDAEGRYTLGKIVPGTEVIVHASTAEALSKPVGPLYVGAEGLDEVDLFLTEPADALVSGTVVDLRNRPLRARVAAGPAGRNDAFRPKTAMSDNAGYFILPGLGAGEYRLVVRPGGGEQQELHRLRLGPGQQVRNLRLVYDGDSELVISGSVTDEEGAPVQCHVQLLPPASDRMYIQSASFTGVDGGFRFDSLSPGSYSVRAEGVGYAGTTVHGVEAGTENVRIILPPAPKIEGVVQSSAGAPVTAFELALVVHGAQPGYGAGLYSDFRWVADAMGRFSLDAAPGSYDLLARAPGFGTARAHVGAVQPGVTVPEIVITLEPRPALVGLVLSAAGEPAPGASVFLGALPPQPAHMSSRAAAVTDSSGRFELPGQEHTEFLHLSAFHPVFGMGETMADSGQTGRELRIHLRAAGTLIVQVSERGRPAAGAYVYVDSGRGPLVHTTGDDGMARIDNLPGGDILVGVTHGSPGIEPGMQPVFITPGTETRAALELEAP